MTDAQAVQAISEIIDAYRVLREAYHRDMHRESPAQNATQVRANQALAHLRQRQASRNDVGISD